MVFSKRRPVHGYIDAKTGRLDTPNHAIEIAAIDSAIDFKKFSGADAYFFVWENGETAELEVVSKHTMPGMYQGSGSGTPFVLLERINCKTFDSSFGSLPAKTREHCE